MSDYNQSVDTVQVDLIKLKNLSMDSSQERSDINNFAAYWSVYIDSNQQAFQLFRAGNVALADHDFTKDPFEAMIQPLMD